jgi:hypothetical protein
VHRVKVGHIGSLTRERGQWHAGLDILVGWLAGLGDGPIGQSPKVINSMFIYIYMPGSSTSGTTSRQVWLKILDMTGSIQWQTIWELCAPYRIWPHHSWLKRRGHQPKKN